MSRWCDRSIHDPGHSDETCGPLEVARLFGTLVAETILASVHVRAHRQAGHMDASDLIKALQNTLRGGGRPHKVSGYIPFSFPGLLLSQGQHMQNDRSAALDQAEDRRLVLLQRAPSGCALQPAAPCRPPLFTTSAGCPLCPATT